MQLDKSHPIPLYYQLAQLIRERIQAGEWNAGERLPSERELSEQVEISRMTVRQALAFLVRDGTLVVKPGIGTFVARPKLVYNALHLLGFTEEMMRQGAQAASRVLEQSLAVPPQSVAIRLGLKASEKTVKIVRLRMSGEEPVLLETSYIPATLCPGLERLSLEGQSLFVILERKYNLRLERSVQSLEATIANDYEVELFGIEPGTAMILLEGVNYLPEERPAEFFKAVYRGDRFRFQLENYREGLSNEESGAQKVSVVLD